MRNATDFGGAASREWAHIERGREGEGKATILLAPPEKLAAKRKRVSESADATARDACLRALAEGADAAAPDATGAAALLYLASINAPEAHEVMRKVIHDGTDLSVAHALDGKGPLDVALEAGNVWAVRALLSRGAAPLCAPSLTEGCCSLLEFATLHGFVRQAALALTQLLFSALDTADPGEAPPRMTTQKRGVQSVDRCARAGSCTRGSAFSRCIAECAGLFWPHAPPALHPRSIPGLCARHCF